MIKATTATRARFGINNSPVRRKFAEIGSVATKLRRDLCGFRAYFSRIATDWTKKARRRSGGLFQSSMTNEHY
jgi:hypothetical protein